MSLTAAQAQKILESFVSKYVDAMNSGKYELLEDFYHANAVMIEKDKSCLYGKKAITDSLKQMTTECGKTVMSISNTTYEGVGDFINVYTEFEFDTEKAGVLKGRYLQIWRKDGNGYTIYHDEYEMI
ncbi:unnamed protein product [Caenorhabditis bovis]|uniref:DUF4440 domain-containing protein n=1 Tax=Caenorhabditis bovis TaxID=2654633 RepID=A0A8S1FBY1_9PELO|nr:unnamed protein product [Caenorhabditis bovis]